MKNLIVFLNITVAILDFSARDVTFSVSGILRKLLGTHFAFLSVLHFRESMGLRGPEHLYLMKQHFEQSVNETEHLKLYGKVMVVFILSIVLLPSISSLSISWVNAIIGYLPQCLLPLTK